MKGDAAAVTGPSFESWRATNAWAGKLAFTMQVDRWVESLTPAKFHKQWVMLRAIEEAEAKEMDAEPFRQLLGELRKQLGTNGKAS